MFGWTALAIGGATAGAVALRWHDRRAERSAWRELRHAERDGAAFDPAMVAGLPEPARRFFLFAIAPGARLSAVAELELSGELCLGTKERPNCMPMQAQQILAGPSGFVWRVRAGGRRLWFSGSDACIGRRAWSRFWLYGALPVVRAGGGADFARSAAGRSIAESALWLPAALLPSGNVAWEAAGEHAARAVVTHDGHRHELELTMAPDGRPLTISLLRWSRENSERRWQLQPFGGRIGAIREEGGYRVAATVEGGNWFGTDRHFPFYRARLERIRFF